MIGWNALRRPGDVGETALQVVEVSMFACVMQPALQRTGRRRIGSRVKLRRYFGWFRGPPIGWGASIERWMVAPPCTVLATDFFIVDTSVAKMMARNARGEQRGWGASCLLRAARPGPARDPAPAARPPAAGGPDREPSRSGGQQSHDDGGDRIAAQQLKDRARSKDKEQELGQSGREQSVAVATMGPRQRLGLVHIGVVPQRELVFPLVRQTNAKVAVAVWVWARN